MTQDPAQPNLFFSFVVPAHNESRYIEETLAYLTSLDYPKDRYEVIVVENGSTDTTYEQAKKFAVAGSNVLVLNPPIKGVSKARNIGIDHLSQKSEWVFFMDADTIVKKDLLNDFNTFLRAKNKNQPGKYVVGTTQVKPLPPTTYAKLWFAFYDIGHRLTKASYAIEFIKRSLLSEIRFDEEMHVGEDLKLIRDALKKGKFLFFPTDQVWTSTRRFDEQGWWRTFFVWTFVGALPARLRRGKKYRTVR